MVKLGLNDFKKPDKINKRRRINNFEETD